MIEFMTSKVVGTIAACALLGVVLGFFGIQRASFEEQRFSDMCGSVVRLIDGVSSSGSEGSLNVTFGEGSPGMRLDFSFRGKCYDIEIRPGQVIFRQGGLTAVGGLVRAIHAWDPGLLGNGTEKAVLDGGMDRLDREHPVLSVPSGKDFTVESRLVSVSGEPRFATFVHY